MPGDVYKKQILVTQKLLREKLSNRLFVFLYKLQSIRFEALVNMSFHT